jgi:hypothetical protein
MSRNREPDSRDPKPVTEQLERIAEQAEQIRSWLTLEPSEDLETDVETLARLVTELADIVKALAERLPDASR